MEKTNQELYEIILELQEEIKAINSRVAHLKKWSDLNDYYIQEEIDALTDSVNKLLGIDCGDEV